MTTRQIENRLADLEQDTAAMLKELDSFEEATRKQFAALRSQLTAHAQSIHAIREEIKEPA